MSRAARSNLAERPTMQPAPPRTGADPV